MLLELIELERSADRVGRAAPELSLVIDGRTELPQVDTRWQLAETGEGAWYTFVPLIGQIGNPSVILLRAWSDAGPASLEGQSRFRVGMIVLRLCGWRVLK